MRELVQLGVPERIAVRVVQHPSTGCWEWVGARSHPGYGSTSFNGKNTPTHRLMYELLVAPIPAGLVIDHLCRNPPCCNPAHLEPVTMRENILRGVGVTAREAVQTHCKHGHEFTPENTRVTPKGWRICRACARVIELNRDRSGRFKPMVGPTTITHRCGSRTGYNHHAARGEVACQACRDAVAAQKRKKATK